MSRFSIISAMVFRVVVCVFCIAAGGCGADGVLGPEPEALTAEHVAGLVNQLRREQKLPPLQRQTELDHVAWLYCQEMVRAGNFSHTGIDGSHLEDRLKRANITEWGIAGENLSLSRTSDPNARMGDPAAEAVRGWLLSPGHRANLYQQRFSRCGVAVVRNPVNGDIYTVQIYLGD